MGMTPLLPKMTGLDFIKNPDRVASEHLSRDPETSSGPRETIKIREICEILQSRGHAQLLSHLFIALERLRRNMVPPVCPAR